ncbi:hypothetical protein GJV78_14010 [Escherichia alba]|uniref:Uncharacterized protein n=1 Tax=Intestinirhabdus alba TaxID=2899544 RepID=A0A6L6INQ2_9ENTR|nr:hypothetical protein [Intestinirhabdus alba]
MKHRPNPDGVMTPEESQAVLREFAARRAELEKALTEGAVELQRWRLAAAARLAPLRDPLRQAAEKLAHARADAALR